MGGISAGDRGLFGLLPTSHPAVNVRVARGDLASLPEGIRHECERFGLRWFVAEGRRAGAGPSALDFGGPAWERDLVTALRRKGMLWRTEETYRRWEGRLAEFIAPRSPYAATGDDVAAFLSQLAVAQRTSASTQKQSLNALMSFLQE